MWIRVVRSYFQKRINVLQLIGLAILLSLLVFRPHEGLQEYIELVSFLYLSLLFFRILDDAGSNIVDRVEHTDRTYVHDEQLPHFFALTLGSALLYIGIVAIWNYSFLLVLTSWIFASCLLYLIFRRSKAVIQLIALSKYGMLIYLLGPDDFGVCLAASGIVAAYDLLEDSETYYLGLVGLFVCGFALFRISEAWQLIFIALPFGFAFVLRKNRFLKFLPIIYFPVIYFLVKYFL